MNNADQKPTEWSSEAFFEKLNIPFDLAEKLKMFLPTHPLPQGVIRAFHNIGL